MTFFLTCLIFQLQSIFIFVLCHFIITGKFQCFGLFPLKDRNLYHEPDIPVSLPIMHGTRKDFTEEKLIETLSAVQYSIKK